VGRLVLVRSRHLKITLALVGERSSALPARSTASNIDLPPERTSRGYYTGMLASFDTPPFGLRN
jgi:hypothetical protein